VPSETIYDHPLYYDVLFGFDRSREAGFYDRTFARCGIARGEPILEVACGPARVARLLGRCGHRVTGLDRSAAMLAFARAAAAAEKTPLLTLQADMTAFSVEHAFAAACNPLSSFRLLHHDSDVDAHLRCMAGALRPGGVYVLDLALQASGDQPVVTTEEGWEMTRGDVTVRGENEAVSVDHAGRRLRLAWGSEAHLRGYTAPALAERVRACPGFVIESWHPESSRATGVSEFCLDGQPDAPPEGRAMLVLRRR
jgi:SAM-dependent methyltransferase